MIHARSTPGWSCRYHLLWIGSLVINWAYTSVSMGWKPFEHERTLHQICDWLIESEQRIICFGGQGHLWFRWWIVAYSVQNFICHRMHWAKRNLFRLNSGFSKDVSVSDLFVRASIYNLWKFKGFDTTAIRSQLWKYHYVKNSPVAIVNHVCI